MYYPYLRGKQFELIALREFADSYDNYKVMPIIEPVKMSFNSMALAISVMKNKGLKFALILNPQVGDIIGQSQAIETGLATLLADRTAWSPAFIVNNINHNQIITHISNKNYQDVYLICNDNLDTSAASLAQIICEYIKQFIGAQGIQFKSSQHPGGINVVLFSNDKVQCIEEQIHQVIEIGINSLKIG